jgi:hypothetical protein
MPMRSGLPSYEAGQEIPERWTNAVRPSRPRFARHLRMSDFSQPHQQCNLMLRSDPAQPGRVSKYAQPADVARSCPVFGRLTDCRRASMNSCDQVCAKFSSSMCTRR